MCTINIKHIKAHDAMTFLQSTTTMSTISNQVSVSNIPPKYPNVYIPEPLHYCNLMLLLLNLGSLIYF